MIISEKQIQQLMTIAQYHLAMISPHPKFNEQKEDIVNLLVEIENQQSEELKVIE